MCGEAPSCISTRVRRRALMEEDERGRVLRGAGTEHRSVLKSWAAVTHGVVLERDSGLGVTVIPATGEHRLSHPNPAVPPQETLLGEALRLAGAAGHPPGSPLVTQVGREPGAY